MTILLIACSFASCTIALAQTAQFSGVLQSIPIKTGGPGGVVADPSGNIFYTGGSYVYELVGGSGTPVPLGGATPGFQTPWGLALDASQNLYVADPGAHAVFLLTPVDGYGSTSPVVTSAIVDSPPLADRAISIPTASLWTRPPAASLSAMVPASCGW
jgi:hypothetical protein